MLRSITTPDNRTVNLNYFGNTGLLASKIMSNGQSIVFNYEKHSFWNRIYFRISLKWKEFKKCSR